jgi:arylsulfatase
MKRPWPSKPKGNTPSAPPGAGQPARSRPNVLLVMTDQQRWDALGCASDWVETPTIDRLAADGVRFPNAYTNSPVCIPARVSLAIGRYVHNHGVWQNRRYTLPAHSDTWMRRLRDGGYTTAVFGKTHLHPHLGDLRDRVDLVHAWGLDHVDEIAGPRASRVCRSNLTDLWEKAGVYDAYRDDLADRYSTTPWVVRPSPLPFDLYPDVYVGRQTAAYLRDYTGAEPWFCWMSFSGPHEPWDTPEPYASRYRPADMPKPTPRIVEDAAERPRGLIDKRFARENVAIPPDDVARMRADYAGNVTLIDDMVGDVVRVIEERGEWDDTVVLVVSDHGEMNGDQGLIYKQTFFNAASRVPFVVRVPSGYRGATSGGVSPAVVELSDVGSTVLDLTGLDHRFGYSRSVVPVLGDTAREHRRGALSEWRGEIMLATPQAKMVATTTGRPYLLFDLDKDPDESRNLVGSRKYAALQGDLERLLLQRLVATQRFGETNPRSDAGDEPPAATSTDLAAD